MNSLLTSPVDALHIVGDIMKSRPGIVLIDGPSGAGKSSFAAGLRQVVAASGREVTLVHVDQVYQGWYDLDRASRAIAQDLLLPLSKGLRGTWQEYCWERERVIATHTVAPGQSLIVEGIGAIHSLSNEVAATRVWVSASEASLAQRLASAGGNHLSDGPRVMLEQVWLRQVQAHHARHNPEQRCDLTVDTTYIARQD